MYDLFRNLWSNLLRNLCYNLSCNLRNNLKLLSFYVQILLDDLGIKNATNPVAAVSIITFVGEGASWINLIILSANKRLRKLFSIILNMRIVFFIWRIDYTIDA